MTVTPRDRPAPDSSVGKTVEQAPDGAAGGSEEEPGAGRRTFHVRLENFDGPFDLLLQLINQHRMDVTEVALHRVTDDFLAHVRGMGEDWDLDQVTEFLVIAATLLDMKASRLLPTPADESIDPDEPLQAKDLLFARLLAYRAYQQVAALFAELEAGALRRYPRAVALEQRYLGLLPEVTIGLTPAAFADLAAAVFTPKPEPTVNVDHIHAPRVSVIEHTGMLRRMLAARGAATFGELVADCTATLQVVARFLGLLQLYRESAVAFDQPQPLGELTVRWMAPEAGGDAGETGGNRDAGVVEEEYE